MLSLVLLLSVAAGAGTCADHRVDEAVGMELELMQGTEAEAYTVAEYDFEDRLGELGLVGSTLAREVMADGGDPEDLRMLALDTTPSSARKP